MTQLLNATEYVASGYEFTSNTDNVAIYIPPEAFTSQYTNGDAEELRLALVTYSDVSDLFGDPIM